MVLDPLGRWSLGMHQNAIKHNDPVDLVGSGCMIAEMAWRMTTETRYL